MTTKVQTAQASKVTSRYLAVRRMTEELCAGLSPEDCMLQSMLDASPVKWHLAHTTWFFETFILAPHLRDYKPVNPAFRDLFNSYYNAVGQQPQRDRRGLFSRPSFEHVREYRQHVDRSMLELLEDASAEVADLVLLGTHHEQQHQELIVTDFKHGLWSSPLRPAWKKQPSAISRQPSEDRAIGPSGHRAISPPAQLNWAEFGERQAMIGHAGEEFAFDNETPRHRVLLGAFSIASRLSTNAEYLDFMNDGGYMRPELWLSDGWKTVTENGWNAPLYWEERDREWWHYTANGLRPISHDLSAPVTHVSFYEVDAFARWSAARLPSEFEWEVAAKGAQSLQKGNFLDSGRLHPEPARDDQFFGDCWQWTASAYLGYPGYEPAKGALGEYNGKFMVNQMVLRGASCATPKSHARLTYRNFFPPAARWQFSGIRLAR